MSSSVNGGGGGASSGLSVFGMFMAGILPKRAPVPRAGGEAGAHAAEAGDAGEREPRADEGGDQEKPRVHPPAQRDAEKNEKPGHEAHLPVDRPHAPSAGLRGQALLDPRGDAAVDDRALA